MLGKGKGDGVGEGSSRIGPSQAGSSLLLVASLFVLACAPPPRLRHASASSLLSRLEQQSACSRAVLGEAKLHVSGPFLDVQQDLLYRAEVPDKLRLDLFSSLGVTLSTLSTESGNLAVYDLAQKSFFYGPANSCNLERFARVRVSPFALVELLRGRAPVVVHQNEDVRVRFVRPLFSAGYYEVRIRGEHEIVQLLRIEVAPGDLERALEEQRLRLRLVRVKQAGKLLYEVKLRDYSAAKRPELQLSQQDREMGLPEPVPSGPQCHAELPGELSFFMGEGAYRLVVVNEERVHNPAAVVGAYRQEVPPGLRAQRATCEE